MRYLFLLHLLFYQLGRAQVPAGFTDQLFTDDVSSPVGIAFVDSHLVYIWEQDGRIQVFDRGVKLDSALLDIHEEVSGTADHGMLGCVLHPDFRKNGFIYVSYVVDPHYLRYYGTPSY
ncbi:MAG: hypothetical protein HKN76_16085, partial [Saprospiraceae bacterium]|nr:hypothetical protein [Saprospiraceae bacterium]